MTTSEARLFAVAMAALWLAGGALALRRQRAAAIVFNILFAAPVLLFSLMPLLRVAFDRDAYIRQYGRAALGELPLNGMLVALSLVAVVASLVTIRRGFWLLMVGWLANAPATVLLVYLAFWFRIF